MVIRKSTKQTLIIVFVIAILIILSLRVGNDSLLKSMEWENDVRKLVLQGCFNINIDVDGNSCNVTAGPVKGIRLTGCTEMLTTEFLEKPACSY